MCLRGLFLSFLNWFPTGFGIEFHCSHLGIIFRIKIHLKSLGFGQSSLNFSLPDVHPLDLTFVGGIVMTQLSHRLHFNISMPQNLIFLSLNHTSWDE